MEHPDLTWRIYKTILADKQRRAANPDDLGVAYAARQILGRALIAIGTRLTPAPTSANRQTPVAPDLVSGVRPLAQVTKAHNA